MASWPTVDSGYTFDVVSNGDDLGPVLFPIPSIEELFAEWFKPEPFTDPEAHTAEGVADGLWYTTSMALDAWDASAMIDCGQWEDDECDCDRCVEFFEMGN